MQLRNVLLGLVVGLLVGAGLVLAIGPGSDDGDDGGADVDTTPIELPERFDSFRPFVESLAATAGDTPDDEERVAEAIARTERAAVNGTEIVSEAYGGAAAAVADYADLEFETLVTVIAVRAPSSGLFVSQFAEEVDLGLAVPLDEVVDAGQVECLVRNPPTPEGQELVEEDRFVQVCQRTDDELTVRALPRGQGDVADFADVVDEVWDELTGGE